MTLISLEARLRRIEARRAQSDDAIKALSDDDLADALRETSDDPRDRAFADWFQAGADAPLPPGVIENIQRSL